ncbi:catalase family protein [Sphingomonas baiyangensis]|uniref:Catalase n=1 Tax=Sphingomonas baiyangensis TaxID=2572576 RepID=A0A4U1L3Z0_9SPHN|nr:catalase family protein [Sphingomonas baiyangensis]TKD50913.1 catalase [Sphingomonas baiyangensis]
MATPVPFTSDVEQVAADEAQTIDALIAQFDRILETTSQDYGRAVRAVHAKAHGLIEARMTVAKALPPELAQGMFAQPGDYAALLRFSTNAGDILDDAVALPRGVAMKVQGVGGVRLAGSEDADVQDFVFADAPVFAAADPAAFLNTLKLLAATTDRGEGAKKLLSKTLQGVGTALESVGLERGMLKQLGGAPQTHPLGQTYWSQTPYRFGDHIAKWQLVPVSPALVSLGGVRIDLEGRDDALREEVDAAARAHGGAWELRVQLCTDLDTMPIEDATVEWDARQSPFQTVARIEAIPQPAWNAEIAEREAQIAFGPWQAIAAHQPLGGINRARRDPYRHSAGFRRRFNGCPAHRLAMVQG